MNGPSIFGSGFVSLGAASWAWGAYRWRRETTACRTALRWGSDDTPALPVSFAEIESLPDPVRRYFELALTDGQRRVRGCRLTQRGQFLVRPPEGWHPFDAEQETTTRPPGFLWEARIRVGPAVSVRVRDSFVDGTGSMVARLMGLFPIVDERGGSEIAAGALQRYLAEAAWYPTALLPSAGVTWSPRDDSNARAALGVGTTVVWLDFHFGPDGLIERIFTPTRVRLVENTFVPTPWQGHFSEYEERNGMRVPIAGAVEWLLPAGPQPYWRGRLTGVEYDWGTT